MSLQAAAANKASMPVDDHRLGAVALRHLAGVGLDLAAAVSTPYDQPDHCGCGVAERHRWPAIGLHPSSGWRMARRQRRWFGRRFRLIELCQDRLERRETRRHRIAIIIDRAAEQLGEGERLVIGQFECHN